MATDTDEGGLAFPDSRSSGMTLRDYFAGQAMAGMAHTGTVSGRMVRQPNYGLLAEKAYRYADEMIAARKKSPGELLKRPAAADGDAGGEEPPLAPPAPGVPSLS